VLEYDGNAVGYTTFGRSRMHHTPYQGEIFELYVSPVYQGLGFGTRLFHAARSALRDARRGGLVIWALADNEIACHFYLGLGGQPISEGAETYDKTTLRKIAFAWN
jgi:ribosomal protein S18 acetylase RimI-like enzyme